MNEFNVPDVMGEAIGWKALGVHDKGAQFLRLKSMYGGGGLPLECLLWPTDRWYVGLCPHGHTDVPHEGCMCGVYSRLTREQVVNETSYANYAAHTAVPLVLCQLALAGRVIHGSKGQKAALARIARIEVPYEMERLGRRLGETYKVPVGLGLLLPDQARHGQH